MRRQSLAFLFLVCWAVESDFQNTPNLVDDLSREKGKKNFKDSSPPNLAAQNQRFQSKSGINGGNQAKREKTESQETKNDQAGESNLPKDPKKLPKENQAVIFSKLPYDEAEKQENRKPWNDEQPSADSLNNYATNHSKDERQDNGDLSYQVAKQDIIGQNTQSNIKDSSENLENMNSKANLQDRLMKEAKNLLFEQVDIQGALSLFERIETSEAHCFLYFLNLRFLKNEKKAFCHLIASQNSDSFILLAASNAYFNFGLLFPFDKIAYLYRKAAKKVSLDFLENKHLFVENKNFDALNSDTTSEILNMVQINDKKAISTFLNKLIKYELNPANYLPLLKKLARSGFPKALHVLGNIYYDGYFAEKCIDTATHYFAEGAEKKDPGCLLGMGKIFLETKNYQGAKLYFETASKLGQHEADYYLYIVITTLFPGQNAGLSYLINSANKGHLPSLYNYANYIYNLGSVKESVQYFSAISDHSLLIKEYILQAKTYYLNQKYDQALICLLYASELGSTFASSNICYICLNHGKDIRILDSNRILYEICTKLASMGYKTHLVALGDHHFIHEKEFKKAFATYLSASLYKSAEGAYCTSYMYLHGIGVEKSLKKAYSFGKLIFKYDKNAYLVFWYFHFLFLYQVILSLPKWAIVVTFTCFSSILISTKISNRKKAVTSQKNKV